MKRKTGILITLILILLIGQIVPVMGAEPEWYDLKEIAIDDEGQKNTLYSSDEIVPYTRYIMGATATLLEGGANKLLMRSEVFCTEEMATISTSFTLQKKSGNSWVTVGKGSVSVKNSNHMYKGMSASGVSSGTYRCIADTKVTNKVGYSETISVTSGQISI